MRVLVACEASGTVRDAFRAEGHDAWSCDLQETRVPGPHIVGDALEVIADDWDLIIAHPPCTYLSNIAASCITGECWRAGHKNCGGPLERKRRAYEAAKFFVAFRSAAPRVCVENPQPHAYAERLIGRPSQYIHPWQHGNPWTKRTGLWLTGLQPIYPSCTVTPTFYWVNGSGGNRALSTRESKRGMNDRSITAPGIAAAMASQWGDPNPQTLF